MEFQTNFSDWLKIFKILSESQKRWYAAQKALELGYGGVKKISQLTELSRTTITRGIREINEGKLTEDRIRNTGAGRKKVEIVDEEVVKMLEAILDENTAGDPMSALKWTCKTTRKIANELSKKGHPISHTKVSKLLHTMDYTLQANKKALSGSNHPDRDAQFKYIDQQAKDYMKNFQPVISVDAKKKESIGNFKNNGQEWRKKKNYRKVNDHDFASLSDGVAIPYGTYDIDRNEGFVNIGISKNTAEFAVNSITGWWLSFGKLHYPNAKKLLICADGGGSNGSRNRCWKYFIQQFANKSGLSVTITHYPPGTSKWNKIEHRMFSFISMNWKGQPLESYETVIKLIGSTTTRKGLKIKAELDKQTYLKGIKISDKDFKKLNLTLHDKHPKWNYTINPR